MKSLTAQFLTWHSFCAVQLANVCNFGTLALCFTSFARQFKTFQNFQKNKTELKRIKQNKTEFRNLQRE